MSDETSPQEHIETLPTSPMAVVAGAGNLSPWAAIVGPCYTVVSLCRVLETPQEAVLDAAAELRLLRLLTTDGLDLFPAFQVRGKQVHPDLRSVLQVLQSGIDDPWTWAQWLNTPRFNGVIQIDELWSGNVAEVVRDAGHDAWAWHL